MAGIPVIDSSPKRNRVWRRAGIRAFNFMVPDFTQLRKQPRDRKALRSTNSPAHREFDNLKSFQQFDKQTEIALASHAEHLFFELWTTCPSWSPILRKSNGWITVVNPSGKKVPLVLGTIESHYRRSILLGKRFGRLTNYLMLDIDIGSPFHPRNGGIQPILDAMESMGLCRYLIVRSSASGGLHIYFPLAEPVSSYRLACAAHSALTRAGVRVAGGTCELFPNKKAFNAEHNGHRLPLQQDSFILDDDFRCISNSKAAFLQQWQLCTARQDEALLAAVMAERPLVVSQPVSVASLPPIAWTKIGESNEVMKQLVNYGDRYAGLKTIPELGDWIIEVAPQLPGFVQFASDESVNDLTRRNWAYRWAKSHFKSVRLYAATKVGYDHNAVVAAEALERLKVALGKVALSKVVVVGKLRIKRLWHSLSDISKKLFGVGFGWSLFQKHRKLILETVKRSRRLGLSSAVEEDKSTAVLERLSALDPELEKGLAELITARCVTPSQAEGLSASTPPIERGGKGDSEQDELAMGTVVCFQDAGSDAAGIQTRVTGKVTQADGSLLYRLEACAEGQPLMVTRQCLTVVVGEVALPQQQGVIRATAAQLLQVLGKACPFSGPGLWTVRREEVSTQAWGQLNRLVGEG